MANIANVLEAQKAATDYLDQMDEEKSVGYNAILAVNALVHGILAVGVRLDHVISEFSRRA